MDEYCQGNNGFVQTIDSTQMAGNHMSGNDPYLQTIPVDNGTHTVDQLIIGLEQQTINQSNYGIDMLTNVL